MLSERVQRRIDRLLDQAEEAADKADWTALADFARRVLLIDAENADAKTLLTMADDEDTPTTPADTARITEPSTVGTASTTDTPAAFADGR